MGYGRATGQKLSKIGEKNAIFGAVSPLEGQSAMRKLKFRYILPELAGRRFIHQNDREGPLYTVVWSDLSSNGFDKTIEPICKNNQKKDVQFPRKMGFLVS